MRSIAVLAVIAALAGACAADETPDRSAATARPATPAGTVAPAPTASSSPSALPALPSTDAAHTLARLENRAGHWKARLGASGDKGSLRITVTCIGGGQLAVTYRSVASRGGSFTPPCDSDIPAIRDDALPAGPVDLTITPDGNQRWSATITRGARAE